MTVKRMDNVGIVVEDIDTAIEFFTELGLELKGAPQSKETEQNSGVSDQMRTTFLSLAMVFFATFAWGSEQEARCYKLEMTEWKPAINLEGDKIYSIPPEAIELTSNRLRVVGQEEIFAIFPALGAKPSVHKIAYWYADSGKLIHLTWSNGHSGLAMVLVRTKDGLVGTAHTFWDFERQVQTSSVLASKVACGTKRD
jgi:catechol 2,3-dioxygenase-like lactoylglutathione lyase family enzyme